MHRARATMPTDSVQEPHGTEVTTWCQGLALTPLGRQKVGR